jgi:cell division protein FtsQ
MEKIGARLDSNAGVLAATAAQVGFLVLIAAALLFFLITVFTGRLQDLPGRLAVMPEAAGRSLGLNVMRVTIKGGMHLSDREVMAALRDETFGSIIGRPLPLLDPEELRGAVEALGPVKSAAVQKLLPDTVHISIIEREARAVFQNAEGSFFVIDDEGVVIRPSSVTENTEFVTISGTDDPAVAVGFLKELRRHPVLFARTAGIEVIGGRRFDLRFRNGFVAKLPEDGVPAALRRLQSLEAGTGSLAANLDYIDLRDPDWAYYKPKGE